MSDQFLATDLKSGLQDASHLLIDLQFKITSHVDDAEFEGFLTSCPQYKQLLDTLDAIIASLDIAWTPDLDAAWQEESEELERQEQLADAASY